MNSSLSLSVRFNVEEYIFDWVFEKVPCRVIYRKRTFEDSSLEKGRSRQHSGSLSFLPACAVPQGGGFPGLTAVSWFAALPVAVCTGTWSLQLPLLLRRVIPAPDLLNVFWNDLLKTAFWFRVFFFFLKTNHCSAKAETFGMIPADVLCAHWSLPSGGPGQIQTSFLFLWLVILWFPLPLWNS